MATDYKQLIELRDKLEALSKEKSSQFCDECVKGLAARLLAKTIRRTPVGMAPDSYDIVGGEKIKKSKEEMKEVRKKRRETVKVKGDRGRSRKFLTADAARNQKYWSGYSGGTLRRGWTTTPVSTRGTSHNIDVINQVPYASYVEYGHSQEPGRYVPAINKKLKKSWVRGQFMLTDSAKEINRKAPQIVQQKLNKFLQEELK